MIGKSCWCLLAIPLLMTPAVWCRQADKLEQSPDFSTPLPHFAAPPVREPITILPERHVPGTFGFQQMSRAAGTIFSGTVLAIRRQPATRDHAVETVAITFRVENAIRGATPGQNVTISQWMGLWSSGQRYRAGERVLLFLYPPSKLGLTSCVAAPLGRFRVDPRGVVLLSAEHLAAFRRDPVLGGKSRVLFGDFALAVRRASEEE